MTPTSEIVVTPSGLKIVYYDKSHRYKLGFTGEDGTSIAPEFVPSVSTILDKTLPKNLTGWAERLTVQGVIELMQLGRPVQRFGSDAILKELHAQGLRYYQARDAAADRGNAVHKGLEMLAAGDVPKLRDFPMEQRGYVQGLSQFWTDHDPIVLHSELMVASWRYGYAGRMDLLAYDELGRLGVIDLKTSKAIRDSHHFQTAGYMQAVGESGYGVPEWGAIVRVGADGDYEYVKTWLGPQDFLPLVESYKTQKNFEKQGRILAKEAKAA